MKLQANISLQYRTRLRGALDLGSTLLGKRHSSHRACNACATAGNVKDPSIPAAGGSALQRTGISAPL